jgi:DNA-directed RNA polymerase subunit RPC12/RpoP
MTARCNRLRIWLILVVAVPFMAMATVGILNAQPGFQPPGQKFPPNPGGPPGGPGMPGNPGGGVGGNPGGGIGGNPGGGIGGNKIETVWTCPKCGKEVARGAFAPKQCQFCGTQFINGVGNGGDKPFSGGPGGNIGGQPGGQPGGPGMGNDPFQKIWTCGKCGKQAGTGQFAPNSCPHCGTKFINGMNGPTDPGPQGNGGGPAPGGGPPINQVPPQPQQPPNNGGGGGNDGSPRPKGPPGNGGAGDNKGGGTNSSGSAETPVSTRSNTRTIIIVAVVGTVTVMLGVVGAVGLFFLWKVSQKKEKPLKATKRRLPPSDGIRHL